MPRKVLILDTSVMCCWLEVPGKETAGSRDDQWDRLRVEELLQVEGQLGTTFVLPLATLIETGNHISQAPHSRYEKAGELMTYLRLSVEAESPWVAFTDQADLWASERMLDLAKTWPNQAVQKHSVGDATIRGVADYYALAGLDVEIATADALLKAYEPRRPAIQPRRRQQPR